MEKGKESEKFFHEVSKVEGERERARRAVAHEPTARPTLLSSLRLGLFGSLFPTLSLSSRFLSRFLLRSLVSVPSACHPSALFLLRPLSVSR